MNLFIENLLSNIIESNYLFDKNRAIFDNYNKWKSKGKKFKNISMS